MKATTAVIPFIWVAMIHAWCMDAQAQAGGELLGRATWEEREYAVVSFPGRSWGEALRDMEMLLPGFHLAAITNQQEQDFVNEFLQTVNLTGQLWLGAIQIPNNEPIPDKGWAWVTGESWDYTNWGEFEPNDGGSGEYHLAMENLWWNDEGSAIESVGGYLAESSDAEGGDLVFNSGFEACPCFSEEEAELIASNEHFIVCKDFAYTRQWGARTLSLEMGGEPNTHGVLQVSREVRTYSDWGSDLVHCLQNSSDLVEGIGWDADASNPEVRSKFMTCTAIINQAVEQHELQCETEPNCERRIIVTSRQVDGMTVTHNGSLVNDPSVECVNRAPIERVDWYWGDGSVDTFNKMPDGFVHPFPNSHTYLEPRLYGYTAYAFDADGKIIGRYNNFILLL